MLSAVTAMLPGSTNTVSWGASKHNGFVDVYWTVTFRRNTHQGAYRQLRSVVVFADRTLSSIAHKYADKLQKPFTEYTERDASHDDALREQDGETAYSEMEQSLGNSVKIRVN